MQNVSCDLAREIECWCTASLRDQNYACPLPASCPLPRGHACLHGHFWRVLFYAVCALTIHVCDEFLSVSLKEVFVHS